MSGGTRAGWPVELSYGDVLMRELTRRDAREWFRVRQDNADWLSPWDPTKPGGGEAVAPGFAAYVARQRRDGRAGVALPFGVFLGGQFVGQVTVSSITYGALRSAAIGYWIARDVAGRGITPLCVALAADHCFTFLRLHRVEVLIRPENAPSLRVVEKLGFRDEGVRERYLHIAGDWRDHRAFALCAEDVPEGMLARYRAGAASSA